VFIYMLAGIHMPLHVSVHMLALSPLLF